MATRFCPAAARSLAGAALAASLLPAAAFAQAASDAAAVAIVTSRIQEYARLRARLRSRCRSLTSGAGRIRRCSGSRCRRFRRASTIEWSTGALVLDLHAEIVIDVLAAAFIGR